MTNNINLSLILPCYKVAEYLPRCLDSIMNQTLEDIEAICINDGSPDNCLDILNEYKEKYDSKIVIIDKENEGVWKGRKDGIKVAKGKYIGFVDPDDYVAPEYCEKLYNAAKNNNADISICGFDRVDLKTEKRYSQEMINPKYNELNIQEEPGLMIEVNTAPWNKIYKSNLLKNMPELENIPNVLDDMMFLQLVYMNAEKAVFIEDSLYFYFVRKESIINSIKKELIPNVYESFKEVRSVFKKQNPDLLEYLDALAFLHLGVSFMYRLSADKELDFDNVIKTNTQYLNENFPTWNNNKYISRKYSKEHKGANKKIYLMKKFYDFHIFKPFLSVYKFMINYLHIDIKW